MRVTPGAAFQGLAIGLLVSLLFSLVPLLEVRNVKPSRLLRDETAHRRARLGAARERGAGGGGSGCDHDLAGGLLARRAGRGRSGLAVTTLVLHLAGSLLIRLIRPLARARWFAAAPRGAAVEPSRHRRCASSCWPSAWAASSSSACARCRRTWSREFAVDLAPDAPDMFLLDIQSDQVAAVRKAIAARQEPGAPPPRLLPVLRARVVGVEGREIQLENYEDVRGRGSLGREYTITYRPALERQRTRIVAGHVLGSERPRIARRAEVSIEESMRDRFRINVGDTMRFDVLGRTIEARVTQRAARRVGGQPRRRVHVRVPARRARAGAARLRSRSSAVPPIRAARAGCRPSSSRVAPNVSVIDGREMLQAIRSRHRQRHARGDGGRAAGRAERVADPDRRRGDDQVPPHLRGRDLQDPRRDPADDRHACCCSNTACSARSPGRSASVGAIGLTWGISRFALDIPWPPPAARDRRRHRRERTVLVAVVGRRGQWEVLQRKPLATLRAE